MNNCGRCGEEVYFAEQKVAIGKVWHSFCFSCCKCGKLLDSCSVCPYNSELYCPACYRGVSSTPNLPSCFKSRPSRCNPCIPFKPHQIKRNHNNPIVNNICEGACCSMRHLDQNKQARNCYYCKCSQCHCDCCVKGCNLDSQREGAVIKAKGACCNCKHPLEEPDRCYCGSCFKQTEPELPHFSRYHCFNQHIKKKIDYKKSQESPEVHTHPKNINGHCCQCEGCKYCY